MYFYYLFFIWIRFLSCSSIFYFTLLKMLCLKTTQRCVKYGRTQQLGYCPEGWVKHLNQLLVESGLACVLSNIYPALGYI